MHRNQAIVEDVVENEVLDDASSSSMNQSLQATPNQICTWRFPVDATTNSETAALLNATPVAEVLRRLEPKDLRALRTTCRLFSNTYTSKQDQFLLNLKNNNCKTSITNGLTYLVYNHKVIGKFIITNTTRTISCWNTSNNQLHWSVEPSQLTMASLYSQEDDDNDDNSATVMGKKFEETLEIVDDKILIFTMMNEEAKLNEREMAWPRRLLTIHDLNTGSVVTKIDLTHYDKSFAVCIGNLFITTRCDGISEQSRIAMRSAPPEIRNFDHLQAWDITTGEAVVIENNGVAKTHSKKHHGKIVYNTIKVHENKLYLGEGTLLSLYVVNKLKNGHFRLNEITHITLSYAIDHFSIQDNVICINFNDNTGLAPDFSLYNCESGGLIREFKTENVYIHRNQYNNYSVDFNSYKHIGSLLVTKEFVYAAGEYNELVRYNRADGTYKVLQTFSTLRRYIDGFILFNELLVLRRRTEPELIYFLSTKTGEIIQSIGVTTRGLIDVLENKFVYSNESAIIVNDYLCRTPTTKLERDAALVNLDVIHRDGCRIQ